MKNKTKEEVFNIVVAVVFVLCLIIAFSMLSSGCSKKAEATSSITTRPLVRSTTCLRGVLYYHTPNLLAPVYHLSTRLRFAVPVACTKQDNKILEIDTDDLLEEYEVEVLKDLNDLER